MRGSIHRSDSVLALRELLATGYQLTQQDFCDLVYWLAIRCVRHMLQLNPAFARSVSIDGCTVLVNLAYAVRHETRPIPSTAVESMLSMLIHNGAPWAPSLYDRSGPMDMLWDEVLHRPESRNHVETISRLFIDYGALPAFNPYGNRRIVTVADWDARIQGRIHVRHVCCILMGILVRRLGMPKDVARLVALDATFWHPSAWRSFMSSM